MTATAPKLSVVICTHNRADVLPSAIQSLQRQSLDPQDWELIVVGNRCTDATERAVRALQADMPNLLFVTEERLGLCWARNCGAQAARGTYVAYLDDDARAHPDWLRAILDAFSSTTPAPACVGGRVWLDWPEKPAWLREKYWPLYTFLDRGEQSFVLTPADYLVGTNMAFAKDVLHAIGGFAVDLDRKGRNLLSGGDTELVSRIVSRGLHACYAPGAIVWHEVSSERRSRRWLLRRFFWDGMGQPLLDQKSDRRPITPRRLLFDLKEALKAAARAAAWALRGRVDPALDAACVAAQRLGRSVCEARLLLRRRLTTDD